MRFSTAALLVLLLIFIPGGDGEEGGKSAPSPEEGSFFPIHTLLAALDSPGIPWRPDWPLAIPPDGFTLRQGEALAVTLTLGSRELRLRTGKKGLFEEFPFLYRGDLLQARSHFGEDGGLRGFTLEAEEPWNIEFLPAGEAAAMLARISRAGAVYFAVLQIAGSAIPETWYDGEGTALGVFDFPSGPGGDAGGGRGSGLIRGRFEGAETGAYDERYDFDSFGNVAGIENPRGRFSALYNRTGMPRYWERPIPPPSPGNTAERGALKTDPSGPPPYQTLTLQWDEQGLLVRLAPSPPSPEEGQGEEYRYEYTLDERGNWIERREWRMIRRSGVLVPEQLKRISRIIEYPPED
jgi:hypothetical protein